MEELIKKEDAIKAVIHYLDLCCITEVKFSREAIDYNRSIAEEIFENVLLVKRER